MEIRGKRVLITGGTGKLGREIMLAFIGCGARVLSLNADLRSTGQIRTAVRKAARSLGGVDILVNSAAIFRKGPLSEVTERDWEELFKVNLRAPFFLIKEALKYLVRARPGRVINISDTYASSPAAGFVPYGITKAGVLAMTKGLAKELAPKVLVNCVCPNVTDLGKRSVQDGRAVSATLLKRPVKADDVVSAVLFLSRNSSMTGQMIYVDGGKHV